MTALPGKPASNATSLDDGGGKVSSSSPGARLQRARESQSLTVIDVASQLNLSQGVVKSLESDDYRALPSPTFVKGYIRSYARVLNIPAEDLVRNYESITGCNQPKLEPVTFPSKNRQNKRTFLAIAIVSMLILIALVWLLWPVSNTTEGVAPEQLSANVPTVSLQEGVMADEPAADQPGSLIDEMDAGDIEAQAEVMVQPDEPIKQSEADIEPQAQASVTDLGEQAVLEAAIGTVSMAFTGDCWVEVRDASGALIFSNLKRNGDTLTLQGTPPMEAKLGNGDMVTLSYNNEPVSFLTPSHKVVRVRLGE